MLTKKAQPEETSTPVFKTNAEKFVDKLVILQWNADAILTKQDELKNNGMNIFIIQDTKLVIKDKTPKFPGYTVLRRERGSGKERRTIEPVDY